MLGGASLVNCHRLFSFKHAPCIPHFKIAKKHPNSYSYSPINLSESLYMSLPVAEVDHDNTQLQYSAVKCDANLAVYKICHFHTVCYEANCSR